jgi:hypothetical protein
MAGTVVGRGGIGGGSGFGHHLFGRRLLDRYSQTSVPSYIYSHTDTLRGVLLRISAFGAGFLFFAAFLGAVFWTDILKSKCPRILSPRHATERTF